MKARPNISALEDLRDQACNSGRGVLIIVAIGFERIPEEPLLRGSNTLVAPLGFITNPRQNPLAATPWRRKGTLASIATISRYDSSQSSK
jgi:hypothetical protein